MRSPKPHSEAPWVAGRAPCSADADEVRLDLVRWVAELREGCRSRTDHGLLDALVERLERDDLGLPSFPDTPSRLDAVLRRAEPEQRDVLAVIERDARLVGDLWSEACGVAFRSQPKDLGQAVTRLGLDTVWRLGVQQALRSLLFVSARFEGELERLRDRATVGAEIAAWLAREGRGPHYVAGSCETWGFS